MAQHLLRIGVLGQVGRFASSDGTRYPRRSQVIVRTVRGLELAEVLSHVIDDAHGEADGTILRRMTVEDQLLAARLERRRLEALKACEARLREAGLAATLVDVEPLFDGQSLYFYFLGDISPETQAITAELADVYEAHAEIGRFADTLTHGCGPDCGTEAAAGQGCSNCSSHCAVASACHAAER